MRGLTGPLLVSLLVVGCFEDAGSSDSGSSDGTTGDTAGTDTTDTTAGTTTSGSAGSSSTAGSASASGTSTTDSGSSTTTDSGGSGTTTDTTAGTTGPGACPPMHECVPEVPAGWLGPVAVGAGANQPPCPPAYPDTALEAKGGFQPGVPQCACNCLLGGVSCELIAQKGGGPWMPQASCTSPPNEDECLSAEATANCQPQVVDEIPEPSWAEAAHLCQGGAASGACDLGVCYPAVGPFGDLCVYQDGDLECPGEYPDKTLYYLGYDDNRSCSQCTCEPSGQACTIDLEICSVGFYQVQLKSDGADHCLNSSDGDGVSFLSSNVTNQGTCSKAGGELQGMAAPKNAVTVCCAP